MHDRTAGSGGSVFTEMVAARPILTVTFATTFMLSGAPHAMTNEPLTRGAPSWALERGDACRRGGTPASARTAAGALPGGDEDDWDGDGDGDAKTDGSDAEREAVTEASLAARDDASRRSGGASAGG